MTITIGTITFDHIEYDADGDVLYLSVGEPREPADSYGTPEGHNVRYDENGRVIALTLVNAKWLLERKRPSDRADARQRQVATRARRRTAREDPQPAVR